MYQWIEQRSTDSDHLHDTPAVVWRDCVAHFTKEVGPNFYGLDKTQMQNLVYHARERTFGGNTISKVETQYGGTNKAAFMWYSSTFSDDDKMEQMMCFALPQPLNLLVYPMVSLKNLCCYLLFSIYSIS